MRTPLARACLALLLLLPACAPGGPTPRARPQPPRVPPAAPVATVPPSPAPATPRHGDDGVRFVPQVLADRPELADKAEPTPDGRLLVADGVIWDLRSQTVLRALFGHHLVAVSGSGRSALFWHETERHTREYVVWDLERDERRLAFAAADAAGGGDRVFARVGGGNDLPLRVLSFDGGETRGEIVVKAGDPARNTFGDVQVSPDGRFGLSKAGTHSCVWDLERPALVRCYDDRARPTAREVPASIWPAARGPASSDDGSFKLAVDDGGRLRLEGRGGPTFDPLARPSYRFQVQATWTLAGDTRALVARTGSADASTAVEIWDLGTGKLRETLAAPFAVLPDLRRIVAARSFKGELQLVDLASGARKDLGVAPGYGAKIFLSASGRHLTVADDARVDVVDLAEARVAATVPIRRPLGGAARLTSDGKAIVIKPDIEYALRWDLDTLSIGGARLDGACAPAKPPPGEGPTQATLSGDGAVLAGACTDGVQTWDAKTGKALTRLPITAARALALSRDGAALAVALASAVELWDVRAGKRVWTEPKSASRIAISGDGARVAILGGYPGELAVLGGPKPLSRPVETALSCKYCEADQLALSEDGAVVVASLKHTPHPSIYSVPIRVAIWRADREEPRVLEGGASALAVSRDGGTVALARGGGVEIRRGPGLTVERTLDAHRVPVTGVSLSGDGRLAVTTAADGSTRLTRTDTGESISLVIAGGTWLAYSDDGYFDASRLGDALLGVAARGRGYRVDQLAVRNNRPDLLLSRMGIGAPGAIDEFASRYRARVARLGLREGDLDGRFEAAPSAKIVSIEPRGARADVTFELEDPQGQLARYMVYVNGVPVGAAGGAPARGKTQRVTESVVLSEGPNEIEVGAMNARGLESLRDTRTLRSSLKPRRTLYFLGVGASEYRDARLNIALARKEVEDLAAVFRRATPAFDAVSVRTFVDEQATTDALRGARAFLQGASVHDTVVVALAGHGSYTREQPARYVFVTHDTDLRDLPRTAASFDLIEDLLAQVPARKKLLLLDTCESGERDGATAAGLVRAAQSRGLSARSSRALVLEDARSAPPPRPFLANRDRFLFNDLARRTGAVVLSSSLGTELSYEKAELENGAFTEAVLTALTSRAADRSGDGWVSADELRRFVAQEVPRLTGDLQHPTVDRDNRAARIALPVVAPGP